MTPDDVDRLDTLEGIPTLERRTSATRARRGFVTLLCLVILAAATGLLGGRTWTASAIGGGYNLTLQYPGIERAGIDTVWELKVVHPGGFSKDISIAVTGNYFDLFETQGFYPTPSATTRDANNVYMTFSKPAGDTFVVTFDAYIQPYSTFGKEATVSLIDKGVPVASIHYHTWLAP